MSNQLTAADIKPHRCYEAKKPAVASDGVVQFVNDRQVLWVSTFRDQVQYNSPSVKFGRHYPKVTMEKFLKWAARDVTEIMPTGEWRLFANRRDTTAA
jgi:hypothetical protein